MNQRFGNTTRSAITEDQFSAETSKDKFRTGEEHGDDKAPAGVETAKTGAAKDPGSIDLSDLRDDIAKLTNTVGNLIQKQTATARDQVVGAVGVAGDTISQSASDAQDRLMSIEQDVGSRIKSNPWSAVAIAALVGLLIGRMS